MGRPALSLLRHRASPASIEIARNKQSRCYFNPAVAGKGGVRFPFASAIPCQGPKQPKRDDHS